MKKIKVKLNLGKCFNKQKRVANLIFLVYIIYVLILGN